MDEGLIIGVAQPCVLDQVLKVAVATTSPRNVRADRLSIPWIDDLSGQSWEGSRQLRDVLDRADCEVAISLITGVFPVLIVR